jgi:hypothetical protein
MVEIEVKKAEGKEKHPKLEEFLKYKFLLILIPTLTIIGAILLAYYVF